MFETYKEMISKMTQDQILACVNGDIARRAKMSGQHKAYNLRRRKMAESFVALAKAQGMTPQELMASV